MSYCRHCKINWLYSSQDKAMGACASAECVAAERAARMQAAPPSGHELAKKNATHVLDRPEARAATMTFQFSSDRRNVGVDVPPLTEGLLLEQPQLIFRPNKILLSPGAGCEKHPECLADWECAERCAGADRMPIGSVGRPRRRLKWFTVMSIRIGKNEQFLGPLPADRFAWYHKTSPVRYDTCQVSQILAVRIRNDDPKQMHRILVHAVGIGVTGAT